MIFIADAGSSKTQWSLVSKRDIICTKTGGINPVLMTEQNISELIQSNPVLTNNKEKIQTGFFYGAGCANTYQQEKIKNALNSFFTNTNIHVYSDLYGAARSLFHNSPGIICILGTGSACGRYDGKHIIQQSPSLGFILGDEGSGAYMGKDLLKRFFYGELPKPLETQFIQKYKPEKKEVLSRIHKGNTPSQYLAHFCYFLKDNQQHPYIRDALEVNLKKFIETHIIRLKPEFNENIRITGSVAWFFRDILLNIIKGFGLTIDNINQAPIEGLIEYHKKEIREINS
ncbi:MAG: hypothetical protein ACLFUW_05595 [Bacteroidales bacterium]